MSLDPSLPLHYQTRRFGTTLSIQLERQTFRTWLYTNERTKVCNDNFSRIDIGCARFLTLLATQSKTKQIAYPQSRCHVCAEHKHSVLIVAPHWALLLKGFTRVAALVRLVVFHDLCSVLQEISLLFAHLPRCQQSRA